MKKYSNDLKSLKELDSNELEKILLRLDDDGDSLLHKLLDEGRADDFMSIVETASAKNIDLKFLSIENLRYATVRDIAEDDELTSITDFLNNLSKSVPAVVVEPEAPTASVEPQVTAAALSVDAKPELKILEIFKGLVSLPSAAYNYVYTSSVGSNLYDGLIYSNLKYELPKQEAIGGNLFKLVAQTDQWKADGVKFFGLYNAAKDVISFSDNFFGTKILDYLHSDNYNWGIYIDNAFKTICTGAALLMTYGNSKVVFNSLKNGHMDSGVIKVAAGASILLADVGVKYLVNHDIISKVNPISPVLELASSLLSFDFADKTSITNIGALANSVEEGIDLYNGVCEYFQPTESI